MPMLQNPSAKYAAFTPLHYPERQWPNKVLTKAPIWLSSDLRDGNQSLIEPMDSAKKMRFFKALVAIGFKEIEVGFPSASQTEFDFVRTLIEGGHIPEDVTIQVLTQARDDLIARTFESLRGARTAIVHYYNATAPSFRRIVFQQDKAGVQQIAVQAARTIQQLAAQQPETKWRFEYSPEVFTSTETDFAVAVCNAVVAVFQPTPQNPLILNLPATIEVATPNCYADQIEWFCQHIQKRDSVLISLHTHNDRGTGVAATELGLLAGADRVEGCLFGNGERTGNVDLMTLALNLYTQGIHPQLDFSDIDRVREVVEACNQLPVHPRHPYVGELVHTAFSGSHQDAIRKGFAQQAPNGLWEVPYLPIDPADLGRTYEAVIRVNSQSGKGGVAYLLEQEYGLCLPRTLQIEFSQSVQRATDQLGVELSPSALYALLERDYLTQEQPFSLQEHSLIEERGTTSVRIQALKKGQPVLWEGSGKGPLEALVAALPVPVEITAYHEHALGSGTQAKAAAYIQIRTKQGSWHGIGVDTNLTTASFRALFSALNRAQQTA